MPEARAFHGFQIAMQEIHSETYSLLIDQDIDDHSEKATTNDAPHAEVV